MWDNKFQNIVYYPLIKLWQTPVTVKGRPDWAEISSFSNVRFGEKWKHTIGAILAGYENSLRNS